MFPIGPDLWDINVEIEEVAEGEWNIIIEKVK